MNVSFQLYSSRSVPSQIEFLKQLQKLGYTQVEGYGGVYENPAEFRAALDDAQLKMVSGHFGLDQLEQDLNNTLETAKTLGITHTFAPYLNESERPVDTAGYKAFSKRLTAIHKKVTDNGLNFGWHNHDFELKPLADGGVPLQIILEEAPDIAWEGDLAWIAAAKYDPFTWVESYGARLTSVHVKDLAPAGENTDEDGWADVGAGVIDWKYLVAKVRSKAPDALMVMEHDKPADPLRFAQVSINNFNQY